ncbi:AAA domain-containing protein [Vibrio breoganii]|uniref:AAA domain-containing protein n=1 Tax=Vibrio breoganii TaxID=553239 RepID=UPI000C82781D|nr:AAA domain-containing protein [Vibrio breoganii]PMG07560.1 hypothetical protein BCV00_07550 [Vibrio breoganii]PMJ45324.1 hypothetical protein BCU21_13680 [Vibrio breoganii]PMK59438.1 hypothetical protein BCT97_06520 [Vibrio breoganii]PMM79092.1 hypothetical protein BCT45_17095 [Vibrio breoganii]PMO29237.1 hypothetical protein BCT14_06695 [Vibrio breoganii]
MNYHEPLALTSEQQERYFSHQLATMEREYKDVLKSSIATNHKKKNIFIGEIAGFDEARGNLLVRFKDNNLPRLDTPYLGSVFKGAPTNIDIVEWTIPYESFLLKHQVYGSEATPVFYTTDKKEEGTIVAFKDVDAVLVNRLLEVLKAGKKIRFVVAKQPPPFELILALKKYVAGKSVKDPLLSISLSNVLDEWQPTSLDADISTHKVIEVLDTSSRVVVQGPPGTGKSHLISEVVAHYQLQGKRICIAAQTNKTLVELCHKPLLSSLLKQKRIYKNNIKSNELSAFPLLQSGNDHFLNGGDILLATFYSLKNVISELTQGTHDFDFDLLIVEEASQANLALISALSQLTIKVLLVGDPVQMSPIVLDSERLFEINPRYKTYSSGLTAIACNTTTQSFMLRESFRLNSKSASQTGLFYQDKLRSKVDDYKPLQSSANTERFIDSDGGAVVCGEFVLEQPDELDKAITVGIEFLEELVMKNPHISTAILSPYVKVVNRVQAKIAGNQIARDVLVETVDRVQGITVDFTILILPLTNPLFTLELERFNVATSRARSGNLIFISPHYRFLAAPNLVKQFLSSAMQA